MASSAATTPPSGMPAIVTVTISDARPVRALLRAMVIAVVSAAPTPNPLSSRATASIEPVVAAPARIAPRANNAIAAASAAFLPVRSATTGTSSAPSTAPM